jgi:hypothetical protein
MERGYRIIYAPFEKDEQLQISYSCLQASNLRPYLPFKVLAQPTIIYPASHPDTVAFMQF